MTRKSVSHLQAIGYAVLAFTVAVGTDTFMKLAGESGVPPHEIVSFMGLFAAVAVGLFQTAKGDVKKLWPKKPRNQIGCAVLTFVCFLANAIALKHLPLTLFYVTVFTMPMIIAVLGSLFLKERLTLGQILAVVLGFVGVLIAVNPFQDFSQGEWIGYAAGLTSAICGAVMFAWLRRMTQSESVASITFFTSLIQALVCGAFLFWNARPLTLHSFVLLTAMSAMAMAANVGSYVALRHTTASNFGQIHYTQIATGAMVGYFVWSDVPTLRLWIGAAVIILSGVYVARHAHKEEKKAKRKALA